MGGQFKSSRYQCLMETEFGSTTVVVDVSKEAEAIEKGFRVDELRAGDPRVIERFPVVSGQDLRLHGQAADYLRLKLNATEELRMRSTVEDLIRAAVFAEEAAAYLSGKTTTTEEEANLLSFLRRNKPTPETILFSGRAEGLASDALFAAKEHFPELYQEAAMTFRAIYVYGHDGLDGEEPEEELTFTEQVEAAEAAEEDLVR